jgi:hypothetical protein
VVYEGLEVELSREEIREMDCSQRPDVSSLSLTRTSRLGFQKQGHSVGCLLRRRLRCQRWSYLTYLDIGRAANLLHDVWFVWDPGKGMWQLHGVQDLFIVRNVSRGLCRGKLVAMISRHHKSLFWLVLSQPLEFFNKSLLMSTYVDVYIIVADLHT